MSENSNFSPIFSIIRQPFPRQVPCEGHRHGLRCDNYNPQANRRTFVQQLQGLRRVLVFQNKHCGHLLRDGALGVEERRSQRLNVLHLESLFCFSERHGVELKACCTCWFERVFVGCRFCGCGLRVREIVPRPCTKI